MFNLFTIRFMPIYLTYKLNTYDLRILMNITISYVSMLDGLLSKKNKMNKK